MIFCQLHLQQMVGGPTEMAVRMVDGDVSFRSHASECDWIAPPHTTTHTCASPCGCVGDCQALTGDVGLAVGVSRPATDMGNRDASPERGGA